jgi:tRNA pseudouridine55 synthase
MHGFLVVDKPDGITSHDVVAKIRRICHTKRVGHTGTLDPFATGVLPLALGDATKAIPYLDEAEKEYQAVMRLGITTDSQDYTGKILCENKIPIVTETVLQGVFSQFTGTILQTPPMFSAVKVGGTPLYKRARMGEEIERAAREITIYSLTVSSVNIPYISFSVRCSRGTYVRTLASDIGDALGCGAHLARLRRVRSGPFGEEMSYPIETIVSMVNEGRLAGALISTNRALSHIREMELSEAGASKVRHGALPGASGIIGYPEGGFRDEQLLRLVRDNKLMAIAVNHGCEYPSNGKTLRLLRVFT